MRAPTRTSAARSASARTSAAALDASRRKRSASVRSDASRQHNKNERDKRRPAEWVIFENTHEAIIDQETFDIVQRIRDGRRRLTPMGEMPVLSGMLFCADGGAKLYQVRHHGWTYEQEFFVCATYWKIKGGCTSHQIHNVQVEEILLRELRRITAFAREREDEFVSLVTQKGEKELNRQLRESTAELAKAEERIRQLDTIISRLYEDNVSDERFAKMSASYEAEQKSLESRASELRTFIDGTKGQGLNAESFLSMVRKYSEITGCPPRSSAPSWKRSRCSSRKRFQGHGRKSRSSSSGGTSSEPSISRTRSLKRKRKRHNLLVSKLCRNLTG